MAATLLTQWVESEAAERASTIEGIRRGLANKRALLIGSSFSAAIGGGGSIAGYGGGGGTGDDDGGLSSGEIAAIIAGGGGAVAAILYAIRHDNDGDIDVPGPVVNPNRSSRAVPAVRLSPQRVTLAPGSIQAFDVQVQYAGSKEWKSVTASNAASIRLVGDNGAVVPVDAQPARSVQLPTADRALAAV